MIRDVVIFDPLRRSGQSLLASLAMLDIKFWSLLASLAVLE
jgi:hypothetical protein